MNSKEYWKKREAENLRNQLTDEKEYVRRLNSIYDAMLKECEKEINAFYTRYANAEGITIQEARKRISQDDIKAYEAKAEKYVRDKIFSKEANAEMRLYNATMRINRLEMLKANIGLELIAGHEELAEYMQGILKGRTEEELARQAGILGKTIRNNARLAESIVNASFHNATFSQRIWANQDLLRQEINKSLVSGLIGGKNARVVCRDIQKKFDVTKYAAERLMRTELARVQTDAQQKSFKRNGFEEYMYITNSGCCPICQAIDGKVFEVRKMLVGENAPPMHPNCRCSIAAYEDSKEYEAWLDYISKGGTTDEWNKSGKAKWKEGIK